jgi:ATPase subunit of ABC transporter with duplicated ATPase domains
MNGIFRFSIRRPNGSTFELTLEPGHSVVFIGANGSGKTRLGVYLEETIQPPTAVQRIAAQKSLNINMKIPIIALEQAESALRYGNTDGLFGQRSGHRWGNRPASHLLSDFDALLQSLFAEQNRVAKEPRKNNLSN